MALPRLAITAADISTALSELGVAPTDTMLVHSDLQSSLRVVGRTVPDKVATIAEGLRGAVRDGTLVLPTFTYSFTRGEDFDVDASPSTVGALTEWFRRRPGVRRTPEPLFSVAIDGPIPPEWEEPLFDLGDKDCFGPASIFAYLEAAEAKLVCYGVDIQALTFAHYVEQRLSVPYRLMKDFHGAVRRADEQREVTATYYVRELTTETEVHLHPLADALLREGRARTSLLPDGPRLLVTDTASVLEVSRRELASNPDFLLRRGHPDITSPRPPPRAGWRR